MEITQEYIKILFEYHDEGYLIWKVKPSQIVNVGEIAGTIKVSKNGGKRRAILIKRKRYYASRLIFLYHNGWLPLVVDHEDRNSMNDKIGNLRPANEFQNNSNRTSSENSTSKYLGVSASNRIGKWRSQIGVNKKIINLGNFNTEEEAALVYNRYAVKHHGEFANLNIIKNETE